MFKNSQGSNTGKKAVVHRYHRYIVSYYSKLRADTLIHQAMDETTFVLRIKVGKVNNSRKIRLEVSTSFKTGCDGS